MGLTGEQYIPLEWCFIVILFCFVSLRIHLRYQRRGSLNASDYFVIFAWFIYLFQVATDTVVWKMGMFESTFHPYTTEFGVNGMSSFEDTRTILIINWIASSFYYAAMYSIKASMLLFYVELVPRSQKKLIWTIRITSVLCVIGFISSVLLKLFICHPIKTNWTPGPHYCDTWRHLWSNAYEWSIHILTDIIIYVIPIFLIKKLQLPRSQKIAVGMTFGVGFFCILFANMMQISILLGARTVVTYLFTALEQTWAIIVVCCPAFRALVARRGWVSFRERLGNVRSLVQQSMLRSKAKPESLQVPPAIYKEKDFETRVESQGSNCQINKMGMTTVVHTEDIV